MASVGIIGATGYVGTEIVRLLQNHPDINITSVVSHNLRAEDIGHIPKS